MQNRLLFIFISFVYQAWGQQPYVIDEQVLPNGIIIRLTSNGSGDENKRYSLESINRATNDTIVNFIDSVQHAHCSPPNSIFFINDSIGFFTESGGCYASYNWLFRTNNRGLSWQRIESGSRTDGNSLKMLTNESFYMFNELKGIIVWKIEEGRLIYSLTNDGGINWIQKEQTVFEKEDKKEFQSISFSADGQVTLVCSEAFLLESHRKKVEILQSNNFGETFRKIR